MAVLNGTSGNDELFGFSNADTISGFEGNDQIFGNGGNDSILAGVGDDLVYGNEGNDTISAGSGNDTLSGGMGNDILTGGLGTDTAIFEGNQNNFNLTLDVSGLLKVTDLNVTDGDEGADTLDGIEAVKFVDGSWQVIRGEFLVNTTTIDSQQNPAMTALADGGFVVTWQSNLQDGSGYGIYGQRYNNVGVAVSNEFRVNTTTADSQQTPTMTALADGGFVVTWQSNLQDGSGYGIYGQRYNNAGVAVGSEFRVNTTTADAQTKPTIAGLVDGGFVVTWQSQSQSQSQFQSFQVSGIWGQRYNNAGVAVGSEFYRTSLAYNAEPRIAALADGGFVMAWFGVDADSDSYGVTGQRYNNSGQAASTFLINTYTLSQQMRPAITGLSDGGFVVTWQSATQDTISDTNGVYGQRYSDSGAKIGNEFRINTTTQNAQDTPAITGLSDGGFVATWQSADDSGYGIWGQRYNSSGAVVGDEFRVNATTFNAQVSPVITALSDGGFVVAWQSFGQDGVGDGIFVQRFNANGQPISHTIVGFNQADTFDLVSSTGVVLLAGGAGNDLYKVGALEMVSELTNEGIDTVETSVSYGLSINVEDLILTGVGVIDGYGNSLNNIITGNTANNILDGGSGDDTVSGGDGDDNIRGGFGNDVLSGGTGTDILIGGSAGNDLLQGGTGSDTYIFGTAFGQDTLDDTSTTAELNTIDLSAYNASQLTFTSVGDDYVITITGTSDQITLKNVFNADHVSTYQLVLATETLTQAQFFPLLVNSAPEVLNPIGDLSVGLESFSYQLSSDAFFDIDGDILTYSATLADGSTLPSWLVFDAQTQTFSGTATDNDARIWQIKVIASDGQLSAEQTFYIDTTIENRPPMVLEPLQTQETKEGEAFNYQLPVNAFIDLDGDVLTYSASLSDGSALPEWLTFDATTQIFSGTPTDNDAGALLIKVVASDGMLNAEQEFTVNIEDTPYSWWDDWNNIDFNDVSVLEGETSSWQLSALEHPDTVVLNYTAVLADGSALPEWLTFDANTLTFSGTPSFEEAGVLTIKVVATDVSGLSAEQVFSLDVIDVNRPPELTGTPVLLISGTEDNLYTLSASDLLQGYTDADGDSLTVINLTATNGVLTDNQDGTYTFYPNGNFNGIVNINYQVSDGRGGIADAVNSFVIDAVNDAPFISNMSGEVSEDGYITGGGGYYDVEGDVLSYRIIGDVPLGFMLNGNDGAFSFSYTPTVADQSLKANESKQLSVQYVANDGQADSLPATIQITINGVNDAPQLTGAPAILANGVQESSYIVSEADLLQGFSDVDGDTLSVVNIDVANVTNNHNGTYTLDFARVYPQIALPPNERRPDETINFNYQVSDGHGGLITAQQTVTLIHQPSSIISGTTNGEALVGGITDNTYIVNHVRDVVVEADASGGTDTVQSSLSHNLGNNVENLVLVGSANLSGTGNNLDNSLEGNNGNNRLLAGLGNDTLNGGAGGDTLNGGEGADVMYGGTGNDTFTIENANDLVVEFANEGYDTVNSFITYTLTANVERLNLENAGGQIDGFGNDADNTLNGNNFANYLFGGAGNDTLQGKGGADSLEGGLGDDLYYVDNTGDIVTELANEGIDKVSSSVSYTLTANVEQLFLTGIAGLSATGNELNNIIYGNNGNNQLSGGAGNDSLNGGAGNDVLDGGAGNDTLVGGLGNDTYLFDIGLGRDEIDNKDSIGNDILLLGVGISVEQVWLRQTGNDLEVSVIGTASSVKVKGWYGTNPANKIDSIQLSTGDSLLASEVQSLVDAMAVFAPPPLGQTILSTEQQNALAGIITASW